MTRPHPSFALALLFALMLPLTGCGMAVYTPSRNATFELDPGKEVNDEEVKKAFEARPQMAERPTIAYYTFDPERANDIEAMLKQVPNVASVYRLPKLLVTGQRRFDEGRPGGGYGYGAPATEISVKKLRLLAARAHADLLLVFDYGHRTGTANGWTALTPLLIPILFVPFLDNSVESYLETHVIDVRNGYLYAHLTADEKGGNSRETIWGRGTQPVIDELWVKLLGSTRAKLGEVK